MTMVAGLSFLATAVATLFAEATFVRWRRKRSAHEAAWTVALALFALASAALATGASTGWDRGTFRVFYLFGAVLNVPWLGLGTIFLLLGERAGRRVRGVLVFLSGLAAGVVLTAPIHGDLAGSAIPVGKEVFGVFPRVLAAAGSGLGAVVVFGGAAWSAARFARAAHAGGRGASRRDMPPPGRMAGANGLIAAGTLILSGGGLLQGVIGHDEAFTISLAAGITVIYAGFLVASRRPRAAAAPETRSVAVAAVETSS
jgi:hypothetical protein